MRTFVNGSFSEMNMAEKSKKNRVITVGGNCMRSRVVGGVALVLGLLVMIAVFINDKPVKAGALLGGLLFIGLGGYYLFTGKRAATMNEFIADGHLGYEGSEDARAPQTRKALIEKLTSDADYRERMEALRALGQSDGISGARMDAMFQHVQAEVNQNVEEMISRIAGEQGLSEADRLEVEATLRQVMAKMDLGKKA